jgi:hypothetical protein
MSAAKHDPRRGPTNDPQLDKTLCGSWKTTAGGAYRASVMYPGLAAASVDAQGRWVIVSPHDRKAGSQGQAHDIEAAKAAVDDALCSNGWHATDLPDTRPPHLRPLVPVEPITLADLLAPITTAQLVAAGVHPTKARIIADGHERLLNVAKGAFLDFSPDELLRTPRGRRRS